jgi:hypothetical protein
VVKSLLNDFLVASTTVRYGEDMDTKKSLQELERDDWGEPTFESHLVQTCHRLRRKLLNEFTTEDLRFMIGQGIGLRYLVPLALEELEADPFSEDDFYPGDLLDAVLRVGVSFWTSHPDLASRVKAIVGKANASLADTESPRRGEETT